jgi:hypothetical protein
MGWEEGEGERGGARVKGRGFRMLSVWDLGLGASPECKSQMQGLAKAIFNRWPEANINRVRAPNSRV